MKPSCFLAAVGQEQMGVAFQLRQAGTVGGQKIDFGQMHHRPCLRIAGCARAQPPRQARQRRLALAAEDGFHAQAAQHCLVHRRIQPVHAQMRMRRQGADARQGFDRDAGGGMHADIHSHQARAREQVRIEFLQRQVDALHVESVPLAARRRARPARTAAGRAHTD